MQRTGLRASFDGVVKDLPLGVFTTAAPVLTYNPATQVIEGAAAGGGGAPSGPAGGDLGGTYPNPTVTQARGLRETSGPTTLVNGAMPDGGLLQRSGATLVGSTGPTITGNMTAARFIGPATGLRETGGPTDLTMGALAANSLLARNGANQLVTAVAANIPAHAAQHNPGGADSLFTGTYAANDMARWTGTQWDPKFRHALHLTADNTAITSTTLVDVANLIFAIPRAGTYMFEWNLSTSQSVANTIAWSANYSGTITNFIAMVTNPTSTTGVVYGVGVNNTATASGSRSVATDLPVRIVGRMVVSTTGNLSAMGSRQVSGNLIVRSGSFGWVHQYG